jgi:hypothetical protein
VRGSRFEFSDSGFGLKLHGLLLRGLIEGFRVQNLGFGGFRVQG